MRVDLHMHSNYSDGSLSPQKLIAYVKKFDVGIMALTDHDTIAGVSEAQLSGKAKGIEVFSGVELSIDYPLEGSAHLHLLGLLIDIHNTHLISNLERLKKARDERAKEIIAKMQSAGLKIDYNEVKKEAGVGSIGRPHIAALMVQKGFVPSHIIAFKRYLGKGGPYYVPKVKLDLPTAIALVHQAGGLSILAHPYSLGFTTYLPLGQKILELKEMGLDGIEAYYSRHDRYFTGWLLDFAARNDLLIAGGSDFHGKPKPEIKPGIGTGHLNIPEKVAWKLKQKWQEKKRWK